MLARFWMPSVRLSLRLSVTRVLCDKTKQCTVDISIPHEMIITLVFLLPTVVLDDAPALEICAQSNPPPSKNADLTGFRL